MSDNNDHPVQPEKEHLPVADLATANSTFIPYDPTRYLGVLDTLVLNNKGNFANSVANAIEVMKVSPSFSLLRFNDRTATAEYAGEPVTDHTLTAMERWFAQHGMPLGRTHIDRAMPLVADHFDPVLEYLESLTWDGIRRLDTWLTEYLGCEPLDGLQSAEYLTDVGRTFMIGAVARSYKPGCQMDTMLILEGIGGIGKTTAIKTLFGDWYVKPDSTPGTRDFVTDCLGCWAAYFEELATFSKADYNVLKGVVTSTKDVATLKYDKHNSTYLRRHVFVGDTNHDEYIPDDTGIRRWLPVRCKAVVEIVVDGVPVPLMDTEGLKRDRDQLWAEAVHDYRDGRPWWGVRDHDKYARARLKVDDHYDAIRDYLHKEVKEAQARHVQTGDLHPPWAKTSEIRKLINDPRLSDRRIADVLKQLGWTLKRTNKERKWILATWVPSKIDLEGLS